MQDYKKVIWLLIATGAVLIACLGAISYFAPGVSPIAMMATFGAIIAVVLAIGMRHDLAVRFKMDSKGEMSGSMGVMPVDTSPRNPAVLTEPGGTGTIAPTP